jgi:hypothetical protein
LRAVAGPVALVTQRQSSELPPALAKAVDRVVTIGTGPTDGFLATNSLLAMATAWCTGLGYEMPERLPLLDAVDDLPAVDPDVRRLTVLFGPDQRTSAVDLEARMSESGVIDMQMADPRNFAHGRHFGYGRRSGDTALVSIAGPESCDLVDRTLANLRVPRQHIAVRTSLAFPVGALDALSAVIHVFARFAQRDGIDPGRPHVEAAGRRLYHMSWSVPHVRGSRR